MDEEEQEEMDGSNPNASGSIAVVMGRAINKIKNKKNCDRLI